MERREGEREETDGLGKEEGKDGEEGRRKGWAEGRRKKDGEMGRKGGMSG